MDSWWNRCWTWDQIRGTVIGQGDLDDDLRRSALHAIDRLERHLGADWPATRAPRWHPLDDLTGNIAPWTRQRLVELAQAMDALESDPGWKRSLRGRIRHYREAANALLELDLARTALTSGLAVELQPPAAADCYADLAVSDDAARLLVEITAIDDRSLAAQSDESFQDRICDLTWMMANGFAVGCELAERIPIPDRPEIEQRMQAFWDERLATGTPARLDIPGVVRAWAAPLTDGESRARYAREGPEEGFTAWVQDRTWLRIARGFRGKSVQLPAEGDNLIIMQPPSLLTRFHRLADLAPTLGAVLDDLPNVGGIGFTVRAWKGIGDIRLRQSAVGRMAWVPDSEVWARLILLVTRPDRLSEGAQRLLDRWLPTAQGPTGRAPVR